MFAIMNYVALGVFIGLVYSILFIWYSTDVGDSPKQTTIKVFIGILIANLIFYFILGSSGLVVGFTASTLMVISKSLPKIKEDDISEQII